MRGLEHSADRLQLHGPLVHQPLQAAIELIHLMEELIAPADEETREPVPA